MRDQRTASAVRYKQRVQPHVCKRLIKSPDPVSTVWRFPVILDNTFHSLISSLPAALPMPGIGVMKSRKN